jgi:site-specific DNA recombinase
LVFPEVAAKLDRQKSYGVWWFNRERIVRRRTVKHGQNGREYRYRTTRVPRSSEEWIAVPVPDAGVPRGIVETAREAIKDNRPPSSAGHRQWQLSGRILYCGVCGRSMTPRTTRGGPNRPKLYCYYACLPKDRAACSNRKKLRAQETEALVWEVVRGLLTDPEQLRSDLEEMIEQQRRGTYGDPNREAKAWLQKMAEADQMRGNYQEMAARNLISLEELAEKLGQLDETRAAAERNLATLKRRQEQIEQLEQDKDTLLESYASMAPDALDSLSPEERRQVYKMLKLRVTAYPDAHLEVGGILTDATGVCSGETPRA